MIDVAVDLGLALDVGPDPIILLLLALIADALFGGGAPRADRARFSPRAVLARMIGGLERRLNREWRGAITRLIRGLLLVVVVAALSYGAGWALLALAAAVPFTLDHRPRAALRPGVTAWRVRCGARRVASSHR